MAMPRWAPRATRALAIAAVLTGTVLATPPAIAGWFDRDPEPASAQAEGAGHRGPKAYHAMCARDPKLCMYDRQAGRDGRTSAPAGMNRARWDQLLQVNDRLNRRIREITDRRNYGVSDYWTIGQRAGDCEDYIIAKKHALIGLGWAADQLLYAVVEGRYSEYHAVLVVRTEWGDYVLDNLTGDIAPWQDTRYRFIIRQSAANPHAWVHVAGSAAAVSAAASAGIVTR